MASSSTRESSSSVEPASTVEPSSSLEPRSSIEQLNISSVDPNFAIKLPPVQWIPFTMHRTQHLGVDKYMWQAWRYTWKAILLASGVPHDGSMSPARFLLSKHDDHALAVLVRTTISTSSLEEPKIVGCITAKPIFAWFCSAWPGKGSIEIVYPSQLSKGEAAKFSVRGEPLEIIEYDSESEN
ncbi:hypothetical protein J7T55_010942 [Diaporthe amygdali]|uniref:uncharacterized protein n=1 Tax=Phomopsis amygdali TaxID=1214568 RepID=UPI0022FDEBE7|nr:uncharacterized protein J7T55_010942 [Diaporthe amygdali]KAJ0104476.1 hypothetical protein J7T55_010942 [Diaporthe amygdali]